MKNGSFARFDLHFSFSYISWPFSSFRRREMTRFDVVWTWRQMFNFVFLSLKRWFQFNSMILKTSSTTWNFQILALKTTWGNNILYKLECCIGISTTEKNRIANQLLTCHSLYLAPWMNGNVNKVDFFLLVRCLYQHLETWLFSLFSLISAEFDDYEFGKMLGAGGFGQVIAANQRKDNLPVC